MRWARAFLLQYFSLLIPLALLGQIPGFIGSVIELVKLPVFPGVKTALSLTSFLVMLYFYLVLIAAVFAVSKGEKPGSLKDYVSLVTLPMFLRSLTAALLYLFLVSLGAALFIVPGIFIAVIFSLAVPVIAIEGAHITTGFERSYSLIKPCFWKVSLLVFFYIFIGFAIIVAGFFTARANKVAAAIIFHFGFAVLNTFIAITMVSIHQILVKEKEIP